MPARELYNRDGITIDVNEHVLDSHDVWFGKRGEGDYQMLPRGTLRELATSSLDHVRTTLNAFSNGTIHHYLRSHGIPLPHFVLALAQARIEELKNEVGSLILDSPNPNTLEYLGTSIPVDPDDNVF